MTRHPDPPPPGTGDVRPGAPALSDDVAEVEVEESELLLRGAVWTVRRDRFAFGEETLRREYVDHPGSVAVLAIDGSGRVLLIRQYRHAIRARDWEIPAGLMDLAGEDPWRGARRELAEEADLQAERWEVLLDISTTPGASNESVRIFLARGISSVEHDFVREAEEAEIEVRWVPLEEVVAAVLAGRVQNAITASAVLAAHAARASDWTSLRAPDSAWPRWQRLRAARPDS